MVRCIFRAMQRVVELKHEVTDDLNKRIQNLQKSIIHYFHHL